MLGFVRYSSPQARVRARRSRRLPPSVWTALVAAPDASAVLAILRGTTYADCVDRQPVEVQRKLIARIPSGERTMVRSLQGAARELVEWYARRFEVQNLKTVVRALAYQQPLARARAVLLPLAASPVSWERLLGLGSVAALPDALRRTRYARPLEEALERYRQEPRPFFLEVSLDLAYFQRLVRLIDCLGASDRRDAERFLGRWIDLQNLLWAYRYRLFARMTPEEIVGFTLHRAYRVDLAAIRRIATGSPLADEVRRLDLALPTGLADREALVRLEVIAARRLVADARRVFTGSLFHLSGVLAHAVLAEAEVRDLVTLLEARTRGVPSSVVRPVLVGEASDADS